MPLRPFLLVLLLPVVSLRGGGPPRFRESSFSIFLRRDFSFPVNLDVSDLREYWETDEWYRGRAESVGGAPSFVVSGLEGFLEGKDLRDRLESLGTGMEEGNLTETERFVTGLASTGTGFSSPLVEMDCLGEEEGSEAGGVSKGR